MPWPSGDLDGGTNGAFAGFWGREIQRPQGMESEWPIFRSLVRVPGIWFIFIHKMEGSGEFSPYSRSASLHSKSLKKLENSCPTMLRRQGPGSAMCT